VNLKARPAPPAPPARAPAGAQQETAAAARELAAVKFSEFAGAALRQAAEAALQASAMLDTTYVLLALLNADTMARWNRIFLTSGNLQGLECSLAHDSPEQTRISFHDAELTPACIKVMRTAEELRRLNRFEVIDLGLLALALVADPSTGAARTLGVPSRIEHGELLLQIHRDVLGLEIRFPSA
jgi:hypothetical protein